MSNQRICFALLIVICVSIFVIPSARGQRGRTLPRSYFTEIGETSEGFTAVAQDYAVSDNEGPTRHWGFIDSSGAFITNGCEYNEVQPFREGMAAVAMDVRIPDQQIEQKQRKWGFVDQSGRLVTFRRESSHMYDGMHSFSEGFAAVMIRVYDNRNMAPGFERRVYREVWNFIDKSGNPITRQEFAEVEDFHQGKARVRLGDRWGCLDKTGKVFFGDCQAGVRDNDEVIGRWVVSDAKEFFPIEIARIGNNTISIKVLPSFATIARMQGKMIWWVYVLDQVRPISFSGYLDEFHEDGSPTVKMKRDQTQTLLKLDLKNGRLQGKQIVHEWEPIQWTGQRCDSQSLPNSDEVRRICSGGP